MPNSPSCTEKVFENVMTCGINLKTLQSVDEKNACFQSHEAMTNVIIELKHHEKKVLQNSLFWLQKITFFSNPDNFLWTENIFWKYIPIFFVFCGINYENMHFLKIILN